MSSRRRFLKSLGIFPVCGLIPNVYGADVPTLKTPCDAMDVMRAAFQSDPDYAYGWHCNLAMAYYDAGRDGQNDAEQLRIANDAASRFMKMAFGVETVWKSPETTDNILGIGF